VSTYPLRVADRAARTALQVVLGYLLTAGTIGGVDWTTAGLAAVFAVIVSVLQAAVDLPVMHHLGWAGDVLGRALRTFAQTALGSVGAATLLTDVAWGTVLSAAALAALVSVVTSIIATPIGPKGTPELVR
jgi:hypothetical protein